MKKTLALIFYSLFLFTGMFPIPMANNAPQGPPPFSYYYPESASLNNSFGNAMDMTPDGNRIVVGANQDTVQGNTYKGKVYLYGRNGNTYSLEQVIPNPEYTGAGGDFGTSVAISSDGNRIVIGFPGNYYTTGGNWNSGSYYIYTRNTSTGVWSSLQEINPTDQRNSDGMGYVADMTSDGQYIIIGSSEYLGNSVGRAWVYKWNGSSYALWESITSPTGATYAYFGNWISVSPNGTYLAVGHYLDATGATGAGSIYVYTWNGTQFTATTPKKIPNPTPASNERFGMRIAIADNGSLIATCLNTNEVYVYGQSGGVWTLKGTYAGYSTTGGSGWVSISPSGDQFATSNQSNNAYRWSFDGTTSIIIRQYTDTRMYITTSVFSSDGITLLFAGPQPAPGSFILYRSAPFE